MQVTAEGADTRNSVVVGGGLVSQESSETVFKSFPSPTAHRLHREAHCIAFSAASGPAVPAWRADRLSLDTRPTHLQPLQALNAPPTGLVLARKVKRTQAGVEATRACTNVQVDEELRLPGGA